MAIPIAIDIVFLLPKEVFDEAKRINKILIDQTPSKIDFSHSKAVPHISLAMGGIFPGNLEKLKNKMEIFSSGISPIELKINSLITKCGNEEKITSFQFEKNRKLNTFHADLINLVRPNMQEMVNAGSFLTPDPSTESINWVNEYFQKHSLENFWPHITLGSGEYKEKSFPGKQFLATRLAICKLDDYCTCKEIIWETILH